MKKWLTILLAAAICAIGLAAQAEDSQAKADSDVNTLFDEGSFVIQIDAGDDLAWIADDMAQDDSVVKLAFADNLEGVFVARYEPTGDGDVTVGVRHYSTGVACDRLLTWDLRVSDGAVREVIGGSEAVSPDEADQALLLSGEWLEAETQFTQMTVEKSEYGWEVEIAAPTTHGAYIFKTTVYYDCDVNGFVYDKGKFWDVPITDSDEPADLGEAKIMGTTGVFIPSGDEAEPYLTWYDSHDPEAEVVFGRADAASAD